MVEGPMNRRADFGPALAQGIVKVHEVLRARPDVRSEALECVQLAAAFARASLLALLPDEPACWRLVSSTALRPMKGARPRRPRRHGGSEFPPEKAAASCTHSKASRRARSSHATLPRL